MKKKFGMVQLEETHFEREPEVVVESIEQIQTKFDKKVSSEGIYNLHATVENIDQLLKEKIESLQSQMHQISLKDENFNAIIKENEVLRRQNVMLENRCKNLEYKFLELEKKI